MDIDFQYWVNRFGLVKHPEGGYYKESYRSNERIQGSSLPDRYPDSRVFGTSIYFLLTNDSVSNFHRLRSDEIWHYHYGGTIKIHFIEESGFYTHKLIGMAADDDISFQVVIPRNTWFAAEVMTGNYGLVGCTVSPGFEFEDFELADRTLLSAAYPQHQTLISRFTKD